MSCIMMATTTTTTTTTTCSIRLFSIGFTILGTISLLLQELKYTNTILLFHQHYDHQIERQQQQRPTSSSLSETKTTKTTTTITTLPLANHLQQEERTTIKTPRIVILAGPHKTGTTSLQDCMVEWTTNNNNNKAEGDKERNEKVVVLKNWTWAIPTEEEMLSIHLKPMSTKKRFAPLVSVLRDIDKFQTITTTTSTTVDKEQVKQVYKHAFQSAWNQSQNNNNNNNGLIIGSEGLDHLVDEKTNPTKLLNGLLELLPPPQTEDVGRLEREDIEVVITYRSPRVDHLLSIWRQMGGQRIDGVSTTKWFTYGPGHESIFASNSLRLTYEFLKYDSAFRKVTLVNSSGAKKYGGGMCQVVACHVLNVPCTKPQNEIILENDNNNTTFISYNPQLNQKEPIGNMDLTTRQLNDIDHVMTIYDCTFQTKFEPYIKSGQLRILYDDNDDYSIGMFEKCNHQDDNIVHSEKNNNITFSWMIQEIQTIIANNNSTLLEAIANKSAESNIV